MRDVAGDGRVEPGKVRRAGEAERRHQRAVLHLFQARGLKPIRWSNDEVVEGQWAITPGVAETPHAVGVISALPRRIRPPDKVTKLDWEWSTNSVEAARLQDVNGKKFVHDWKVESLQSCSACHR